MTITIGKDLVRFMDLLLLGLLKNFNGAEDAIQRKT
jgi:hypothetical protein